MGKNSIDIPKFNSEAYKINLPTNYNTEKYEKGKGPVASAQLLAEYKRKEEKRKQEYNSKLASIKNMKYTPKKAGSAIVNGDIKRFDLKKGEDYYSERYHTGIMYTESGAKKANDYLEAYYKQKKIDDKAALDEEYADVLAKNSQQTTSQKTNQAGTSPKKNTTKATTKSAGTAATDAIKEETPVKTEELKIQDSQLSTVSSINNENLGQQLTDDMAVNNINNISIKINGVKPWEDENCLSDLNAIYDKVENYIETHPKEIHESKFASIYILSQIVVYMWYEIKQATPEKPKIQIPTNIKSVYYDSEKSPEEAAIWNNYIKYTLTHHKKITSIKKSLPADTQETIKNMVSPAANIFCNRAMLPPELQDANDMELARYTKEQVDTFKDEAKYAISNTFEAIEAGQQLMDPEYLEKSVEIIEAATLKAVTKLSERVFKEVENSVRRITDISVFTSIPKDAMDMMLENLLTPAQALSLIKQEIPSVTQQKVVNAILEEIESNAGSMAIQAASLQKNVTEKLQKYNDEITIITDYIDQGPDWVVDQIDIKENEFERDIINFIRNKTQLVITKRNDWVAQKEYELYIKYLGPANEQILKAQKIAMDAITEEIAAVKAKAQMAIAKAILKLFGLMGGV